MWVSYNLKLGKPVIFCMNNPEIFTSKERDENEERKRELIELVASGEALLIVGAGSSARVGYVTWNGLLEELEGLANECGEDLDQRHRGDSSKYLAYAEDIKSHISNKTGSLNRYHNLLYELFKSKSPSFDDFHRMLVSLPFRGILTTNYDTVLEAALNDKDPTLGHDNALVIGSGPAIRVHEFLMAMNNDKRITRRIAHLHGKFDISESIILSIEDYYQAYGLRLPTGQIQSDTEWTLHRKLLWAVLATRRVVFVGFSMEDPYFDNMLETVSNDLWGWNKSIHFAIMSISSEGSESSKSNAERLRREDGVGTVFYEDPDSSHQGLEQIIDEIDKACKVKNQSPADQIDWLEEVNQRMERGIDDEN